VLIEAAIDDNQGIVNQPLSGSIAITHTRKATIDRQSFRIGGKPLSTSLAQEVSISPGSEGLVISLYKFQLSAKVKGLYSLDPISVKIGEKTYQSIPSTYEVREARSTQIKPTKKVSTASARQSSSSPIIFSLEGGIEGPTPLYPGQRAKLIYRITYNKNIDLSKSYLPLLYTKEFRKIGDEQIKDYEQGDFTYQDIVQEIEAFKPGTFQYEPSKIEGYAYVTNQLGNKVYISQKLEAKAPPVEIIVNPFPLEKQPASFNGAIGEIQGDLKQLTSSTLHLGEVIQLELTVRGLTNLSEFKLPNLLCQPGFSGFFQWNELPSVVQATDEAKTFKISLRPISAFIQTLPSIELTSFNPDSNQYSTWRSEPIALKIASSPEENKQTSIQFSSLANPQQIIDRWTQADLPLPVLEIQGEPVTPQDIRINWLQSVWSLWIIHLGLILYLLQWYGQRLRHTKLPQTSIITSDEQFKAALNKRLPLAQLLLLLKQAFLKRLKEKKLLAPEVDNLENLPHEGLLGEIRHFAIELDQLQYGKQKEYDSQQIQNQAEHLFYQIKFHK